MIRDLSRFLEIDREKEDLIDDVLHHNVLESPFEKKMEYDVIESADYCCNKIITTKFCPKCNRKYCEEENICFDCLVSLKKISDKTPIREINSKPVFTFNGNNDFDAFENILTEGNIIKIDEFNFNKREYNKIIKNVKKTALTNLDELIKANYVDLDDISIRDKLLLFAKSFVGVEFKSYGNELGYYEGNHIVIDDRQSDSFQITTLIHELSHFILNEILSQIMCKLLDCNKNILIDIIVQFILSYSNFTKLIDEYSAHCCEGRFTIYGYQDYSSFLSIIKSMDGEMTPDEIEITKSIGNTFANSIKDILESFIDDYLLSEIKKDFMLNRQDEPNYEMLRLENCEKLTNEGFMKSIWLVLSDGFKVACNNIDVLERLLKEDKNEC